jgi:hypothetical protein
MPTNNLELFPAIAWPTGAHMDIEGELFAEDAKILWDAAAGINDMKALGLSETLERSEDGL